MMTHGAGYPLYMPTPYRGLPAAYRKKGIRIGDVGMITPNGAFDFLFNACKSDAGVHPAALPDGFELLKAVVRVNDQFDHGECLPSEHVNENISRHTFQCSASEGAVLALPTGATLYEAVNTLHFETHAARHAASWYEYVLKEGRDVSNGSLYFVTECIKSKSWGIAVFYGRTTASDDLRVIFNEGSCQWGRRGKVEARVGPKSKDIVLSDDDEPNQCVFLRGFKIMLRPDVWDKLKSSIGVTTRDGESSSAPFPTRTTHFQTHDMSGTSQANLHQSTSDSHNSPHNARLDANQLIHMPMPQAIPRKVVETSNNHPLSLGQVILEDNFREAVPLHPSDLINAMLLHLKPEATVALVHDSVWCDHLPHDFMADPVSPNVYGLLENVKQAYKAVVGQHGNAVLVDMELDSKAMTFLHIPRFSVRLHHSF
ncbi:hypothetical protein F5887DRAFT_1246950 [Amanita rubescens]|nr:hypothetical protein F5887DRAFT_1246950 [Amanita rubescens]